MSEKEYVSKVIHELDHQKMEVIGVETLAHDCVPLITALLLSLRFSPCNGPQILAVVRALPELLTDGMDCEDCINLAERIKTHLVNEYKESQK